MPPANEARRDHLADAAMRILAREGARGLTHRAVDAEAGEPPGTTSRYFRTRQALVTAVMERARGPHFGDLSAAAEFPDGADLDAVVERLLMIVEGALTVNRTRHLAMAELLLDSTRRPGLSDGLAATRQAQSRLVGDICRAGGIALSARQEALLVATITGIVFMALTTPRVLGLDRSGELRELIAAALPAPEPSRSIGDRAV